MSVSYSTKLSSVELQEKDTSFTGVYTISSAGSLLDPVDTLLSSSTAETLSHVLESEIVNRASTSQSTIVSSPISTAIAATRTIFSLSRSTDSPKNEFTVSSLSSMAILNSSNVAPVITDLDSTYVLSSPLIAATSTPQSQARAEFNNSSSDFYHPATALVLSTVTSTSNNVVYLYTTYCPISVVETVPVASTNSMSSGISSIQVPEKLSEMKSSNTENYTPKYQSTNSQDNQSMNGYTFAKTSTRRTILPQKSTALLDGNGPTEGVTSYSIPDTYSTTGIISLSTYFAGAANVPYSLLGVVLAFLTVLV